jgi:hypothetical protein
VTGTESRTGWAVANRERADHFVVEALRIVQSSSPLPGASTTTPELAEIDEVVDRQQRTEVASETLDDGDEPGMKFCE